VGAAAHKLTARHIDELKAMTAAAQANNDRPEENERMWVSAEEAALSLGLGAAKRRKAVHLIDQVARDARDMLAVSKSAREAGIPRRVIPSLLRAGFLLGERRRLDLSKGSKAAVGETRKRKGGSYKKVAEGKWEEVTEARAKAAGKDGDGKAKKPPGKKGDQPSKGKPSKPPATGHEDPEIRARHRSLTERAKAVGLNLGALHPKHNHNHMDRAEEIVGKHENGAAKYDPKAKGADKDGETADGDKEGAVAAGSLGHDVPPKDAPHETHRLAQAVHDIQQRLSGVEDRLDSPHQKGMAGELKKEGEAIAKKPSPQAVQWHVDRVTSFLKIITGAAVGMATGSDPLGAAAAGGVEGHSSKLHVDAGDKAMQDAREAAQKDDDPKAKPGEKKEEEEAKKAVLIDPRTGRIFFKAARPTPEIQAEPVGEPPEDEKAADHDDKVTPDGDEDEDEDAEKADMGVPMGGASFALSDTKKSRTARPKNEHGHRDDLVPGMRLQLRARHQDQGEVIVKANGYFELAGVVHPNGTSLLKAVHDGRNPHTTIRRYFRLGGERKLAAPDLLRPLRALLKADQVLVQRKGDGGYSLTGDLIKAGVPAYLLPYEGAHHAEVQATAATDLQKILESR
jgi:hypothetical protein